MEHDPGGARARRCPCPHGYQLGAAAWHDLADIARIEAAVFAEPTPLPALRRAFRTPGTHLLVARRGGGVVAFFGFQLLGPVAHVLSNATAPSHRRRGLARALLVAGEGVALRHGARWFTGEVRRSNRTQLHLLRTLGWRRVALCPHFFGNGEDAVLVVRVLGEPDRPPRAGAPPA